MKDILLEVNIKNNILIRRRKDMGLSTGELSDMAGVNRHSYSRLECCTDSPVKRNGEWRSVVIRLADFYRVDPSDLFSNAILAVRKNSIYR
jgi:transcriptional regulator with XRE-family HTH domain